MQTRPEPITQADVARAAGVSPRTVSNVVNGAQYVSKEVRARVGRALDDLGYAPNLVARSLRHGRSGMIALILPLNVEYFAELTDHLVEQARAHSLVVMIDKTDGDPEREREILRASRRSALFDGMIFSPAGLAPEDLEHLPTTRPMVLLGQRWESTKHDRVMIDNVAAVGAATRHLAELGRRRIGFIGPHLDGTADVAHDRLTGYRTALRRAKLPSRRSLEVSGTGFHRADGHTAMTRLLDGGQPPDAVVCYNDPLALGAIRAVHDRGLRVPQDVAVVGCDDNEGGRYSTPRLTTIAQDKAQIARHAVELLAARLAGSDAAAETRHAAWTLITRESTVGTEQP